MNTFTRIQSLILSLAILLLVAVSSPALAYTAGLSAPATDDDGSFIITWDPALAANSWTLSESVDAGASWTGIANIYSGTLDVASGSYAVTGRTDGDYLYRMSTPCFDLSGCPEPAFYSETVAVTVLSGPPDMPSSITVPPSDEDGVFDVSWSDTGADSYQLYRKTGALNVWTNIQTSASTSYSETGLQPGTYTYRVKACNTLGCSAYKVSDPVQVFVPTSTQVAPFAQPVHDESVGAIASQQSVEADGSANYSIPIYTPPGIQGMQPNLSLAYNSNAGNGLVGIGWNVTGLSSIQRCATTIERDGYVDGVDFDENDKFCFNGQRLVAISGEYGADGTEYRLEQDVNVKIMSFGSEGTVVQGSSATAHNPQYFKVWGQDGQIHLYGDDDESRMSKPLEYTECPPGMVMVTIYLSQLCWDATTGGYYPLIDVSEVRTYDWAISESADRYGNRIVYSYTDDDEAGENYISRIDYNFGPGGSGVANNAIQFNYGPRPDVSSGYYAGAIISQTVILENISTWVGGTKLREMKLTYADLTESVTGDSRLESVEECADNVCLRPTTFAWTSGEKGFSSVVEDSGNTNSGHDNNPQAMDINGDGRMDLVTAHNSVWRIQLSNGNNLLPEVVTSTSNSGWDKAKTLRYDNDNRDDLLLAKSGYWYVLKGAVTADQTVTYSFYGEPFTVTIPGGPSFVELNTQIPVHNGSTAKLLDADGDGRQDLMYKRDGVTYIRFLGDSGFGQEVATNVTTSLSNSSTRIMDFNGDGMSDVLKASGSTWTVYVSLGDGDFKIVGAPYSNEGYGSAQLGDMNGDGLTDLILRRDGKMYVHVNKGGEFAPALEIDISSISNDGWNNAVAYDYNADGRTDFLYSYSNFWRVLVSDGETYTSQSLLVGSSGWNHNPVVLDISGNGLDDLALAYSDTWHTRLHKSTVRPDYLSEVENGLGVKTAFEYRALTDPTDPDFYDRGPEVTYPLRSVQNASYLVSKMGQSNGKGGLHETTYQYKQQLIHLQGLGNLGFAEMTTINNDTNIQTTVSFSQDYANRQQGQVEEVKTTYLTDNVVLSDTTNQWQVVTIGAGTEQERYQSRLTNTTVTKRDLNGDFLHKEVNDYTLYDSYNNLKTFTSKVYDESNTLLRTKTTTNSISNQVSNWLIGLTTETTAQVTVTGQPMIIRKSAWEFDATTGRTAAEKILDPVTEAVLSRTDYSNIDAFGHALTTTVSGPDFETRSSSVVYDSTGRYMTSATNAIGHSSSTTYYPDAHINAGMVDITTDANGIQTKHEYDAFGRKTRVIAAYGSANPVSSYTSFQWCINLGGLCPADTEYAVISSQDDGSAGRVFVDQLGRELRKSGRMLDGRFAHVDYTFDPMGHNTEVTEPYYAGDTVYTTTVVYDVLGRAINSAFPDGRIDTVDYDGLTRISHVDTAGKNQSKTELRDSLGNLIQVLDNDNNAINYTYDSAGNMRSVIDPDSNVTTIHYDALGRKTSMDDPDKGIWSYTYNGLGQLITQTDAKGQTTCNAYDKLGRMVKRIDNYQGAVATALGQSVDATNQCANDTTNVDTATWVYDTAAGNALGQVHQINGKNNYQETYSYDSYGRVTQVQQASAGTTYAIETSYDALHRVDTTTYPGISNRLQVKNVYNDAGFAIELQNAANNSAYYIADAMDARGNLVLEGLGNGIITQRLYDAASGRLEHIYGFGLLDVGDPSLQKLDVDFDRLGNLTHRKDHLQGFTEDFTYDSLNRLIENNADFGNGDIRTTQVTYNALGNILSKTGVGTYSYGGTCNGIQAGPHAVTSITSPKATTYCYDANGNMISGDGRTIQYSYFDKPEVITKGSNTTTIQYGPSRSRYQRIDQTTSGTTTYDYVGGIYEKVQLPNGDVEERHYVGGATIVTYENRTASAAGTIKTRYLHKDHLGSTTLITDALGTVVEDFSFDPWGKRRAPSLARLEAELGSWNTLTDLQKNNTTIAVASLGSTITNKGFTGHEQMDGVELIHMNGRVYDADIGRFLSADPFIQDRTNLQALNRYSYVENNPLSYTDPSGYFLKKAFKKLVKAVKSYYSFLNEIRLKAYRATTKKLLQAIGRVDGLSTIINIALNFIPGCQAWCSMTFNAAMTAANGGSFGDILKGAAVAYIASGIADGISGELANSFATTASKGFQTAVTISKTALRTSQAIGSMVAGGISAKAMGGKFIDGVKGAAIGMGIAYGIGRIAQAVKDPPDSTSIELSKKNFSSDEIADIESRIKTAQEDLIGKSFGGGEAGTMAAALALDQNQALTSIANDYGIEPWGVIGGESNTILSINTGFSNSRSFGSVTSLVANDGHTIWHRHPSGSGLWSGDFHTAANSRAKYNVFASGNNVLEGWFVNRSAYKSGAPLQVQRYRNGAWSQVEFN